MTRLGKEGRCHPVSALIAVQAVGKQNTNTQLNFHKTFCVHFFVSKKIDTILLTQTCVRFQNRLKNGHNRVRPENNQCLEPPCAAQKK